MREEIVDIATADGAMETFVCRPERGGPYPPVLFLMDAPGIRRSSTTWRAGSRRSASS